MISRDKTSEELLAEIERLRTENRELLHEIKDLSRIIDTGYKQLVCDRTGLNERQDLPEGIRRMAARIKELEDALVEERAKVIMLIEKLQLVANDPDWQSKGLKHDFDWYLAESKKEIESGEPEDQHCRRLEEPNRGTDPEGKIGPDAKPHKHTTEMTELNADHQYPPEAPRSWQITDERKAALAHLITVACPHGKCNAASVPLAMLKEAGQE